MVADWETYIKGKFRLLPKEAQLNRIRMQILRRGLGFPRQQDLAEKLGVSIATISRAERWGIVSPELKLRILHKLGIHLEEVKSIEQVACRKSKAKAEHS